MTTVKLHNGKVILVRGDCTNVLRGVKLNTVALIIADPPHYKVVADQWDHQWPNKSAYLTWCAIWLERCIETLKSNGSLYLWGSIGEKSDTILHQKLMCDDLGLYFKDWITWKKSRGMGNRKGWLYTREEVLWFVKSNNEFVWNEDHQYDTSKPTNRKDLGFNGQPRKSQFKRYTNVWDNNDDQDYGTTRVRFHYTPKPLPLLERIILAHTKPNDIVLDPFMGSGSTARACVKLNRRCITIENDPTCFENAKKLIQQEIDNYATTNTNYTS